MFLLDPPSPPKHTPPPLPSFPPARYPDHRPAARVGSWRLPCTTRLLLQTTPSNATSLKQRKQAHRSSASRISTRKHLQPPFPPLHSPLTPPSTYLLLEFDLPTIPPPTFGRLLESFLLEIGTILSWSSSLHILPSCLASCAWWPWLPPSPRPWQRSKASTTVRNLEAAPSSSRATSTLSSRQHDASWTPLAMASRVPGCTQQS